VLDPQGAQFVRVLSPVPALLLDLISPFRSIGQFGDRKTIHRLDETRGLPGQCQFVRHGTLVYADQGGPRSRSAVAVKFYSDRADEDGQFAVICDRACKAVSLCSLPGYNQGEIGSLPGFPNVAAFLLRRQFPAATWCVLTVESEDEKSEKSNGVRTLTVTNPTPR
jgi:hypothetical protein